MIQSLSDFYRCEVPGCQWYTLKPPRCSEHGGEVGPEYWEADDGEGEILATRHMDTLEANDDD